MSTRQKLAIKQLSEKTDIPQTTIRYYEKCNLLVPKERIYNRYRLYSKDDVQKLIFIRNAKNLGFSLTEIKQLLELQLDNKVTCKDINHKTEQKLKFIQSKIELLQSIEAQLQLVLNRCPNDSDTTECPIIHYLSNMSTQPGN